MSWFMPFGGDFKKKETTLARYRLFFNLKNGQIQVQRSTSFCRISPFSVRTTKITSPFFSVKTSPDAPTDSLSMSRPVRSNKSAPRIFWPFSPKIWNAPVLGFGKICTFSTSAEPVASDLQSVAPRPSNVISSFEKLQKCRTSPSTTRLPGSSKKK